MANLTTSADVIDDILFRCGEPTDTTSDFYTAALRYLNRAYQTIWMGGGELDPAIVNSTWWWLRKGDPGTLKIIPEYATGTVAVATSGTTITFSAVVARSLVGQYFKVLDHADVFRITAHTAATATATIDAEYTGATVTAATYWVRKAEYDMATDAMNVMGPIRVYQDGASEVQMMEAKEIDRIWPLNQLDTGVPRAFAVIRDRLSASAPIRIRFSHAGGDGGETDFMRADYDYYFMPDDLADDTVEPRLPRQYRKILSDLAASWLMVDKNDNRAPSLFAAAKAGLQAMVRENQRRGQSASRYQGHIFPRPNSFSPEQPPLRTSSGLLIG